MAQKACLSAWVYKHRFNFVSQNLPHKDRFARERFKTTVQVSVTRQIGDRLGLALVPGILLNPAEDLDGEAQLFYYWHGCTL